MELFKELTLAGQRILEGMEGPQVSGDKPVLDFQEQASVSLDQRLKNFVLNAMRSRQERSSI